MRRLLILCAILFVGLLYQSCSKSTAPTPHPAPPIDTVPNITAVEKELLESTNRFGLKLFREVAAAEEADKNIFISPLSVSFALGMTLNGAANETREAMMSTMEFSGLGIDVINQSYRNVIDVLTQLDPAVAFNIANSIWYRMGFPVDPAFIEVNRKYFDAQVKDLDFGQIWAADTINHWVDISTNGKITDIITPPIDPEIVMFLINAIYFKGDWTLPFDTGSTLELPFTLADGSVVPRAIMRSDTLFTYFKNELFQAVDIPYGGGQFSMMILLPAVDYTPDDIIVQLTPDNWSAWQANFSEIDLELGVPKFTFEYEILLNDILKVMGMEVAFDQIRANFSNMIAPDALLIGNLYISKVKHKTFVQVDEVGTEAAAVTVVEIGLTSMPENEIMLVNRPFVFVIHEHETGSILFMGKVADPVWE